MATTIDRSGTEVSDSGRRIVLNCVSWESYEKFLEALGDRPIRTTYDQGTFEIMSPLPKHEGTKKRLARLLEMLTFELDIPIQSFGSVTIRRVVAQRGLEPDECYYLANAPRVRNLTEVDFETVPPPDLAIEVDVSHSSLPRLQIYASLGIPEVWRFDGDSLRAYHLQPDATYAPSDRSLNFPYLGLDEVLGFLLQAEGMDETTWIRGFRDWVRAELAPRIERAGNET